MDNFFLNRNRIKVNIPDVESLLRNLLYLLRCKIWFSPKPKCWSF